MIKVYHVTVRILDTSNDSPVTGLAWWAHVEFMEKPEKGETVAMCDRRYAVTEVEHFLCPGESPDNLAVTLELFENEQRYVNDILDYFRSQKHIWTPCDW